MPTRSDELWNLIIAFRAARIETARLDAELLLMHVLGQDRTRLLVSLQDEITPGELTRLTALANRRLDGEPIAYLTGSREFMGLTFAVNPDVLIPRPETEQLVEWALGRLAHHPDARVIDVGAGSGAIAVALAALGPEAATIVAVDVSDEALETARTNAARITQHPITFLRSDLLDATEGRFDLIMANLPYLTPEQIAGSPSIAREPVLALDGGADGAELILRLINQIPDHLSPGGAVGLELDPGHAALVRDELQNALPDLDVQIRQDLAGIDRFVLAEPRI